MTADLAVELVGSMVRLCVVLTAPALCALFLAAALSSFIQAIIRVQDNSLSFLPRVAALIATLACLAPWLINRLMEYTGELIHGIPLRL